MRASFVLGTTVNPALVAGISLQVQALLARGDEVQVYIDDATALPDLVPSLAAVPWAERSEDWPTADLLICDAKSPALAQIDRVRQGVVFLLCYSVEVTSWVYYVDVCLVHDPGLQAQLHRELAMPLERILLLPNPLDAESTTAYITEFSRLVTLAISDGLPRAPRPASLQRLPDAAARPVAVDAVLLRQRADVMLRDYTVTSKMPVVGGIIAWLRRTLTSHLREPYLDPTLERQVALNRSLVEALVQFRADQETLHERLRAVERALERRSQDDEHAAAVGEQDADH